MTNDERMFATAVSSLGIPGFVIPSSLGHSSFSPVAPDLLPLDFVACALLTETKSMRIMSLFCCGLLVLGLATAGRSQTQGSVAELPKITGTWDVVGGEVEGQRLNVGKRSARCGRLAAKRGAD